MFRLPIRVHSVWCRAALVTILLVLPYSALGSSHIKISILHSVIGPKFVPLWIAYEQGLFAKHGIDVQLVVGEGRWLSQIKGDTFGVIGIPPAIGGVADGSLRDLKLVVGFSSAGSSTAHIVGRPNVKMSGDLPGKRFGVNRIGTGFWIAAVLGLEHLGFDQTRDQIHFVEVGGGVLQLVQALEAGDVDASVLDRAQSAQLSAKGFSVLLDMSQTNIPSIQDGLAVATPYLREHPDVVEKVVAGLAEGIVFSLSPRNKDIVLKTLMARLNISSPEAAEAAYQVALASVNRRPYLSVPAGQAYQRVLARNDPRVITVKIEDLVDNTFVRKLDESGALDRLYFSYGVK